MNCPTWTPGPFDNDNGDLSESNQRIRELNQEGLPSRQISKALRERYGIKLGKTGVLRRLRVMRQIKSNGIQVNYKARPRDVTKFKWYNIIKKVPEEIAAFEKLWSRKPSSRSIASTPRQKYYFWK